MGDYVLEARMHGPRTKISAEWVGPRRIVSILNNFTIKVEHLLTQKIVVVHIFRVQHYLDSCLDYDVQMRQLAEYSDRISHSVDNFKDIRVQEGAFVLLVAWKRLSASSDSWEPLRIMFEGVPTKARDFVTQRRHTAIMRRAKQSINL